MKLKNQLQEQQYLSKTIVYKLNESSSLSVSHNADDYRINLRDNVTKSEVTIEPMDLPQLVHIFQVIATEIRESKGKFLDQLKKTPFKKTYQRRNLAPEVAELRKNTVIEPYGLHKPEEIRVIFDTRDDKDGNSRYCVLLKGQDPNVAESFWFGSTPIGISPIVDTEIPKDLDRRSLKTHLGYRVAWHKLPIDLQHYVTNRLKENVAA